MFNYYNSLQFQTWVLEQLSRYATSSIFDVLNQMTFWFIWLFPSFNTFEKATSLSLKTWNKESNFKHKATYLSRDLAQELVQILVFVDLTPKARCGSNVSNKNFKRAFQSCTVSIRMRFFCRLAFEPKNSQFFPLSAVISLPVTVFICYSVNKLFMSFCIRIQE